MPSCGFWERGPTRGAPDPNSSSQRANADTMATVEAPLRRPMAPLHICHVTQGAREVQSKGTKPVPPWDTGIH